jgi:hypothetical protein
LLEVAKQSLKGILVLLGISPVREFAYVARPTQRHGPCLRGLQYRVIQAHWKQYFALLPVFFL